MTAAEPAPIADPGPPAPGSLPTRLVMRQVSELMFARNARARELVPYPMITAVVFGVVLGSSIAHFPYRDAKDGRWIGLDVAGTLGRPINATAIAQSMGLPLTTVRRRATELVDAGLMVRHAHGFLVAPGFFEDGRLAVSLIAEARDFAATMTALAALGHASAGAAIAAGESGLPPAVIGRLLLALELRILENVAEMYGDLTLGAIMSCTIAANIRHVTADPDLARRYADCATPPPDEIRQPVTIRALATALELPFETVRRRVCGLVEQGLIVQVANGVIVPRRVLLSRAHVDNNRRGLGHFEQMTGSMIALALATNRAA